MIKEFILLICFILIVFFVAKNVDERVCNEQAKSFNHSYSFIGGCMIEYKGIVIPMGNLRITD